MSPADVSGIIRSVRFGRRKDADEPAGGVGYETDPAEPEAEPGTIEPADAGYEASGEASPRHDENMIPARGRRRFRAETLLMRIVATGGIVGIGVAISAIMTSQHAKGWITGLVVALVSVILSAVLWSSREL